MSEILHLNLHREFFAAIANKQKRIEYPRRSRYWRKRLEERKGWVHYSGTWWFPGSWRG